MNTSVPFKEWPGDNCHSCASLAASHLDVFWLLDWIAVFLLFHLRSHNGCSSVSDLAVYVHFLVCCCSNLFFRGLARRLQPAIVPFVCYQPLLLVAFATCTKKLHDLGGLKETNYGWWFFCHNNLISAFLASASHLPFIILCWRCSLEKFGRKIGLLSLPEK